MEYYSASRAELTHRQVDPWGLVAALGHWYLVALDHSSGEERMFRTDRIKSLELTSEPAAVPSDFDPERYRGAFRGAGPVKLSLDISPGAARWFEDYYPVAASEELSDGWRRVRLIAGSERWAAILVLRLAQDVRNVEPASVMEEAGRLAALIVERHEP
jgi:proteasome accessory factor C